MIAADDERHGRRGGSPGQAGDWSTVPGRQDQNAIGAKPTSPHTLAAGLP
jgi:hypothetical protein